jgi:tetratricopeptide (TPR) repeat protein
VIRYFTRALRLAPKLPWYAVKWWKFLNAWDRRDYSVMAGCMEALHAAQLSTSSSHLYLGLCYTHLGQFADAIREFDLARKPSDSLEAIIFCNTYGYALYRCGLVEEAREHVKKHSRQSWPESDREWVAAFLRSTETITQPPVPRRPKLLH